MRIPGKFGLFEECTVMQSIQKSHYDILCAQIKTLQQNICIDYAQ
jgi:hypothetical protein